MQKKSLRFSGESEMYKKKKIAVVVPAYNEEKLVRKTLGSMPGFVDRVYLVDDCSTDKTLEEAKKVRDKRIVFLRNTTNLGVGGAVLRGHESALKDNMDVSVVMAGDAQMDPVFLPKLLDAVIEEGCDYAKGNRFKSRSVIRKMPKHILFGNTVLSLLNKAATGYWSIFDPQNGYTAIRLSRLKQLDFGRIEKGFNFENSMLLNLNLCNATVKDVAIPALYGEEKSHIRLPNFAVSSLRFFVKAFFKRMFVKYLIYNFHPISLFAFSGLLLLLLSLIFGAFAVYHSVGERTASAGTVMLAVLPFLLGFQLLLAAVVLDIVNEPKPKK
jgi:glycosyltransferase involved in cell wall biosynthesis